MNLWKLILITLSALLLLQSDKSSEPSGYYHVVDQILRTYHLFYYDNSLHCSRYLSEELTDSITDLFCQKKDVFAYYDGNTYIDTLRFINFDVQLHYLVYTPSWCKSYVFNPESVEGTYEFVPTKAEQELINFAVSQLDFGDTMPEFELLKKRPHNIIIESAYFALQIKSDKLNTDIVSDLYAEEVTDDIYLLIDALNTLVYDHYNEKYKTAEVPDEKVMEPADEIISKKYGPPPPPEDLLDGSYFDDGME